MNIELSKELKVYEDALPALLSQEGRFALVGTEGISGVFDSYNDALVAGYEKFGLKSFLIKKISAVEQIGYFTRGITPCHI